MAEPPAISELLSSMAREQAPHQHLQHVQAPAQASSITPSLPPDPAATPAAAAATTTIPASQLGMLDLYLADPGLRELRHSLGGEVAPPSTPIALEQQRLYGAERYTELTRMSQAMAAVRDQHAQAMEQARNSGGVGWIEVPMQTGVDAETGQALGIYASTPRGDAYLRDAAGHPVLMNTRVFSPEVFTRAWLAQGGPVQQAFEQFYGQVRSSVVVQDRGNDASEPFWDTASSLDNPAFILGGYGVVHAELTTLDLNHAPRLNQDEAIGFDLLAGWTTPDANIHEDSHWLFEVVPMVFAGAAAWVSFGTLGPAAAAGLGLEAGVGASVVAGAVAGAAGSAVSGLIHDQLSLKSVLQGALAGGLSAGVLQGPLGATVAGQAGGAGTVLLRGTLQGGIQALLGGEFRTGFASGIAAGLAEAISAGLNAQIRSADLQGAELFAARSFEKIFSAAVRTLGTPSDPAYAFAADLVGSVVGAGLTAGAGTGTESPAPALEDRNGADVASDGFDGAASANEPPPMDAPATADDTAALPDSSPARPPGNTPGPDGDRDPGPDPDPDTRATDRVVTTRQAGGASLSLHINTDEHGRYRIALDERTALLRDEQGRLLFSLASDAARPLPPGWSLLAEPGQILLGSADRSVVLPAGTPSSEVQLAALLALPLSQAEGLGLPIHLLQGLQSGLTRNLGGVLRLGGIPLALALSTPELGGGARIEQITPDIRLLKSGADVLAGTLELRQRDEAGNIRWLRIEGRHYTADEVTRMDLPPVFDALSPEELAQLQRPMIYVPEAPQAGGPPPTVPTRPDLLDGMLPGTSIDLPWRTPIETFPAENPPSAADLILTRDEQEQRRFRGRVIGEAIRLDRTLNPADYEAHHILPLREYARLAGLRERFAEWGIDLNDPVNGVALPKNQGIGQGTPHKDTQNNHEYERALLTAFRAVETTEQALAVLTQIKQQLRQGSFIKPKA